MTSFQYFRWLYKIERTNGRGVFRAFYLALDAFKPLPF